MCGDDKVGDNSNSLDLLRPRELDVMADTVRWFRRLLPSILASSGSRQHLTQRDLCPRSILWCQRFKVCTNKSSVERCADVVGMSLYPGVSDTQVGAIGSLTDHQAIIKQSIVRQVFQASHLFPQHHARDNRGTRAA